MKLGRNLFKKDQSIWGTPMIEYDHTKMDQLFSEIQQAENGEAMAGLYDTRKPQVSLETELYLMLHS